MALRVALAIAAASCASPRDRLPQVAALYEHAARVEARNPVIVIHGILGSRLVQRSSGKTVWGAFTADGVDPRTAEGARALALPLVVPEPGKAMPEPGAPECIDVYAAGPLERLQVGLLFSVFSVEVYANILRALGAGGYLDRVTIDPASPRYADDHFTCFSFFYDWRRDNVENAQLLGRFLAAKRVEVAASARRKIAMLRAVGDEPALHEARELEDWIARGYRFDVVAHSMGGLIARYWLRYGAEDLPMSGPLPEVTWAGAREIDRLIVVGTPNFGAIESLERLVYGFKPAFFLPRFHPALLGTMPALYQLLPRNRHHVLLDEHGQVADVDLFDVATWRTNGWGLFAADAEPWLEWLLPDVDAAARPAAVERWMRYCLERARRLHAALDRVPAQRSPSRLHLFAADTQPTKARARLVPRGKAVMPVFDGEGLDDFGDGTVTRWSALGDERQGQPFTPWLRSPIAWDAVTFLPDDHVGLTQNPTFANNMLFELLETQPPLR